MKNIKFYRKPELENPCLIAAWPGMGYVATGVASYLKKKLKSTLLAEIKSEDFFYLTDVWIRKDEIILPQLPKSTFFYWKNREVRRDLIIFLGEAQPPPDKELAFASKVLDVAQLFEVKRVYTAAAAPAPIHHTQPPGVLAVATNKKLKEYLKKFKVTLMREGNISGMNGLLLGVVKQRDMEGICLLGEIPYYTTQIENPRSSQAVLSILTRMLGIEIDMEEINLLAKQTEERLNEFIKTHQKLEKPISSEEIEEMKKGLKAHSGIPKSAKDRIENLFKQAAKDRSKAIELKAELDKWGIFEEYEDRFLDLFKKGHH